MPDATLDPYATHPGDGATYLDAAWRDGFRAGLDPKHPRDPWLWDDDERTERAYHVGFDAGRAELT